MLKGLSLGVNILALTTLLQCGTGRMIHGFLSLFFVYVHCITQRLRDETARLLAVSSSSLFSTFAMVTWLCLGTISGMNIQKHPLKQ